MLVLDANILIRAVLGSKVLLLLREYAEHVEFLAPDVAFQEAREHLPEILSARKTTLAKEPVGYRKINGFLRGILTATL